MTESQEDGIVLEVQESRSIPEGTHTGRIVGLETRDSKVGPYLDVKVEVLDMDGETPTVLAELSPGYPAKITTDTWLGQLLQRFGADIETPGASLDLEDVLKNRAVQFETEDERSERGTYANIVKQSLRPHPTLSDDQVWGYEQEE